MWENPEKIDTKGHDLGREGKRDETFRFSSKVA